MFVWPLHSHMHGHGETPDSWPTCLGPPMLSCVLPDTAMLVLIYHQEALYRFYPLPFSPLLLWQKNEENNKRWCFSFSFWVCFRSVRPASEGGARSVVISRPDSQPALCLHWCHWDSAHNGQMRVPSFFIWDWIRSLYLHTHISFKLVMWCEKQNVDPYLQSFCWINTISFVQIPLS